MAVEPGAGRPLSGPVSPSVTGGRKRASLRAVPHGRTDGDKRTIGKQESHLRSPGYPGVTSAQGWGLEARVLLPTPAPALAEPGAELPGRGHDFAPDSEPRVSHLSNGVLPPKRPPGTLRPEPAGARPTRVRASPRPGTQQRPRSPRGKGARSGSNRLIPPRGRTPAPPPREPSGTAPGSRAGPSASRGRGGGPRAPDHRDPGRMARPRSHAERAGR